MKKLLLFAFCCVFSYTCLAQNTPAIHDETVSTLRDFRTTLNSLPSGTTRDSLLIQTVKLLNTAKSLHDTSQLRRINNYFQYASNTLNSASADDKPKIIGFIHDDLVLKTAIPDSLINLGINSTITFGDPQTVVINAHFSDNIALHKMSRVYWAFYFGGSQEAVITSKNPPGGSSSIFQNPYQLSVNLPGYITFWLIDLPTKQIYKSDIVYKRLTASTKLDLFFTPVNNK